jgi:iturin family lipopeptide synthetase C
MSDAAASTLPAPTATYPADRGIHQLFEEQARQTPEAIAAVFAHESTTYGELNSRANRLARYLQSIGVAQHACVGVLMDRSLYCLVSLLGIIKAGAAYVPIDLASPPKRVAYILTDSNVSHVLIDRHARSLVDQIDMPAPRVVEVENPALYQGDDTNPAQPFDNRKAVYCIYTSGSTGTPKGVLVHHQGLVNYVWWARKQYVGDAIRNFALYSSLSFDLTITSIFVPLICGRCVHIYPESPDATAVIHRVVADNQVEILKLTPSHLALLADEDLTQSRLKVLILGGEDLKSATAAAIYDKLGGRAILYNEYGPTETVVGCMLHRYDPARNCRGSVPIGAPIDNMRIHLLDEDMKPVKNGSVGEIYIGGDGVALGYQNSPQATARAFRPDPLDAQSTLYASGDLGRIDTDGELQYLGRKDFQIKLRGYRIELGEVESALLAHPDITGCTVVPTRHGKIEDGGGGTPDVQLCVYYVAQAAIAAATLREFMAESLPAYMLPAHFVRLDRLPLTANGKVDRQSLPGPELETASETRTGPGSVLEQELIQLWKTVLSVDHVGVEDNFFALGGQSLTALLLLRRIDQHFSKAVSIQSFSRTPTIAGIAKHLAAHPPRAGS